MTGQRSEGAGVGQPPPRPTPAIRPAAQPLRGGVEDPCGARPRRLGGGGEHVVPVSPARRKPDLAVETPRARSRTRRESFCAAAQPGSSPSAAMTKLRTPAGTRMLCRPDELRADQVGTPLRPAKLAEVSRPSPIASAPAGPHMLRGAPHILQPGRRRGAIGRRTPWHPPRRKVQCTARGRPKMSTASATMAGWLRRHLVVARRGGVVAHGVGVEHQPAAEKR